MTLQNCLERDVRKQGLRDSFAKALTQKGITQLYEWQAAALREATAFQEQNFIYQVRMQKLAQRCQVAQMEYC